MRLVRTRIGPLTDTRAQGRGSGGRSTPDEVRGARRRSARADRPTGSVAPPCHAAVRALRGATTVDDDDPEQITERVVELLEQMLERNGVDHDDLISIFFTATDDIHSMFPATAARTPGSATSR